MKTLKLALLASLMATAATLNTGAANYGVDPSYSWIGWMNVYENLNGSPGSYLWGSAWGVTDLRAYLTSTTLTLAPNTNTYNPADPYWVNVDGSGAKWMEANFYVDLGTSVGGDTVTFSGNTIANTLVSPYSSVAFIKEFTSSYGWVGISTAPITTGSPFTVSRAIGAGNIAQFGFMTTGPNANPLTANELGTVVIAVPEPSVAGFACLAVLGLFMRRMVR